MIEPDEYRFLSALLRANSGLTLGVGKEYLLESRLPAVATAFGFASLEEMITLLRAKPHAQLVKAVCDAMTTGETLFFRDGTPFEVLRTRVLPELGARARAAGRPLRIWCAAASTGQEPYSVAMLLAELGAAMDGVRVELLATDYATHVLNRARRGIYTPLEIQRGLPPHLLEKYFTATPGGYRIADALRTRVAFRELNLLEPFTALGQFDLILCRNVLIYFDMPTKRDVLDRLAAALAPGGYLLLGGTESAFGVTDRVVRLADTPAALHVRRTEPPPVRRPASPGAPISPAA